MHVGGHEYTSPTTVQVYYSTCMHVSTHGHLFHKRLFTGCLVQGREKDIILLSCVRANSNSYCGSVG